MYVDRKIKVDKHLTYLANWLKNEYISVIMVGNAMNRLDREKGEKEMNIILGFN